jgi:hypothetical protein
MLVLADVAEVGTAEIPERFTPSLTVLAKETGLDKATVKRHLAGLEGMGWVARERPDPPAMIRGDRTRYRLMVPAQDARGGADNGQGSAQSAPTAGAEEPYPGRSVRLGVGAQSAQGRRTERPLNKEVRSESDQPDPFGSPPPASTADGQVDTETAQTILAAYIDYCASKGVNVRSLRGQYAKTIKEALDAGHSPRFVKQVLARMLTDKVANRPSLLRNRLVEAQTGPEAPRHPQASRPYRNPTDQDDYDDWKRRG